MFSPAQIIILLGDALALQAVFVFMTVMRSLWGGDLPLFIAPMGLLLAGPFISLLLGACEVPVPPPHREVKQTFLTVSFSYLIVLLVLFMTQSSIVYSRSVLVAAWCASLFVVPMVRGYVRRRLCRKSWWGRPVFFLQGEADCKKLWQEMNDCPERGLRPEEYLNINVTHLLEYTQSHGHIPKDLMARITHIQKQYAQPLFVWCGAAGAQDNPLITILARQCGNFLLVPVATNGVRNYWLVQRMLGTSQAFLVRQNLADARRVSVKRGIDLILVALCLLVALPLGFVLSLCIRLSSTGPALYKQSRLGMGGQRIQIYKFRTMVQNADAVLLEHLKKNEALRKEWEDTQKLRDDPRVTTIGKFLRKTSLDELPQLINVLLGNMSLVGPRPIVDNEIKRYGDVYLKYQEVKPGITGLWQISGRNNTTYRERVWFDHYYVSNWSVWMDLWILARTIPVVLRGEGAY